MRTVRQQVRFTVLVLAAVSAMLSLANGASAASTKVSRSCCVKRICDAGCCEAGCLAVQPKQAYFSGDALLAKVMVSSRGTLPCECGSSDQPIPARKSESVRFQHRVENARGGSADPSIMESRETASTRLTLPSTRLPKAQLYLRTSRLLI